jgi:hypothetical protein
MRSIIKKQISDIEEGGALSKIRLIFLAAFIILASVTGCGSSSDAPSSKGIPLDFRRTGGFMNLNDHLVIDQNGKVSITRKNTKSEFLLTDESLNKLQTLFQQANFDKLNKENLPDKKRSDVIDYVVICQSYSVHTQDTAIPTSLVPFIEYLSTMIEKGENP